MFFPLMFMLQVLVLLAALLARRAASRKERALLMLSPAETGARRPLSALACVVRSRAQKRRAPSRISLAAIALGSLLLVFTRNPLLAFGVWPASIALRRLLERRRLARARTMREEQVLELIDSLRQSLRSGLSLQRALEISLEDTGEELVEEVEEVLKGLRMGGGMGECLAAAAGRSSSPSPRLTFTVLGLLHGKGGDLPQILQRLRGRVAEGLEVRREARILTSQSRASGYLVSSLPAVFLAVQAALNPRSLSPLFATAAGNMIVAVALVLNVAAFILIRRMVDPEV